MKLFEAKCESLRHWKDSLPKERSTQKQNSKVCNAKC